MESPSLGIMIYYLINIQLTVNSQVWILFTLWIIHYTNRTLVYPFRIRPTAKKIPVFIVFNGILFNVVNAGLNGYFLTVLAQPDQYGAHWLNQPTTLIGITLFFTGLAINWRADHILIHLRKYGETGYKIPTGFLFKYISSPNLLGEIIEWFGFAVAAWNLPALTFAVWTFANLVPRAKNHHDWYLLNFPNYPKNRKAIFPFIF